MFLRWQLRLNQFALLCLLIATQGVVAQEVEQPALVENIFTLEQCESLAREFHPQLAEGFARIDEARGGHVQAGLYPNPRIDSGNPQTIARNPGSNYSLGFTQEIIRGGKRKLDLAATNEGIRQTEWDLVRRRFEILTNVRQEFYSSLTSQQRAVILETILNLAKKSEKTSQDLFKADQVSETDMLLLRVERRRAEASLQSTRTIYLGRLRQLAATMGQPNLRIKQVSGDLAVALPEFDDETVLAQVTENSPFVQIANIDISRAMLLLRRAEVEPIPNLTVQGGYQYFQTQPHSAGLVGLYIDIPIWNKNQGNIMAAGATVRRSVAQRDQIYNDLTRQLAEALARFHAANELVIKYQEGILPDAKKTLTLVQSAYAAGRFDISRLLQTQRSYFEANLDYLTAQESRLLSAAEIAGLLQLDEFPGNQAVTVPEPELEQLPQKP
jgi:cobalt-zinc-cadmium efflux system outer membrane protein